MPRAVTDRIHPRKPIAIPGCCTSGKIKTIGTLAVKSEKQSITRSVQNVRVGTIALPFGTHPCGQSDLAAGIWRSKSRNTGRAIKVECVGKTTRSEEHTSEL